MHRWYVHEILAMIKYRWVTSTSHAPNTPLFLFFRNWLRRVLPFPSFVATVHRELDFDALHSPKQSMCGEQTIGIFEAPSAWRAYGEGFKAWVSASKHMTSAYRIAFRGKFVSSAAK